MWFKSIFLKTLRDYRVAILAWGLGMGALLITSINGFHALLDTPKGTDALLQMAPSFSWYAEPVAITTPAGYAMWKSGILLLAPCIWALLAGSRTLRGEEERGSLEMLLSAPRGRVRVALEKVAALGVAALLMGLLIGMVVLAGSRSADAGFGLAEALLFGLNMALIIAVFAGLALLVAQFTRQRGVAAGTTGALLVLTIILDSTGRSVEGARWVGLLSPAHYFNLSKPLIITYGTNPAAMLLLAALAAGFVAAAVWIFTRRDLGAPAITIQRRAKAADSSRLANAWSLRSVYLRSLRTIAASGRWWALGLALFGGWLVTLLKQLEGNLTQMFSSAPDAGRIIAAIGGGASSLSANLLSVYFIFIVLLLVIFAVTQASRWASDEEDGKLDLILAASQPRRRVILANFAALATVIAGIVLVTLAAVAISAAATGFALDAGNLVAAMLGMIPLALAIATIGYLLAGWLPASATSGLLSTLVAISFVVGFLGPALEWPDAVLQLSIFHQYGTPLLSGPPWASIAGLLVGSAAALAIATARFTRKDIAR